MEAAHKRDVVGVAARCEIKRRGQPARRFSGVVCFLRISLEQENREYSHLSRQVIESA